MPSPGDAPSIEDALLYWSFSNEGVFKVPNGSRCVIVFREKEESFYKTKIQRERNCAGKNGGAV